MKPAAAAVPVVVPPQASLRGRRIAYAVIAVLLLALATGAYIIFRRPARSNAPTDAATIQQVVVAPPAAPDASTVNANAGADVAKATESHPSAQTDAERAALEKRAADAERKLKEEQQKAAKNESTKPATAATVVTPPAPEPPKQAEAEPPVAQGNTCAGVWVSTTTGEPAGGGLRVMMIEEPETASSTMYNGRTNPKGRWRACGLTPGHRIRVVVFGPRGMMLGSKMQVLNAGLNIVPIQLNRDLGVRPQADANNVMPFPRQRPRRQRP
jgi:Tfp pilus assembly protein FimV